MCTTCGCGHQEMSHEEMHCLGIAHGHGKTVDIAVEQDILSENNRIAGQNRNIWNTTGCWAINLVSSPGSGKTTLLESTIKQLGKRDFHKIAVIEGDQHTDNDAGRIRNWVFQPYKSIHTMVVTSMPVWYRRRSMNWP